MRAGLIAVLCGPSGAGKSTLIAALRERLPELDFSVSATTRAPRPGEQDGVDYHFVSPDRFAELVAQDAFVEHAAVHQRRYGTLRSEVAGRVERGKIVLLDIDVQGARQVKASGVDAVQIFLLPPSLQELERRLRGRATDSPDAIERRLATARGEVAQAPWFDYVVVNDDRDAALADLEAVLRAERVRRERAVACRRAGVAGPDAGPSG